MILQALKEYYDRKPDLPRPGFEMKEIPFVVTLKADGTPVNLRPTYEGERATQYLIPQAVKRSVNVTANLLWDNPEYVLGVVLKGNAKRVEKQHAAFKQRIEDLGLSNDVGVAAVRAFLAKDDKVELLTAFGDSWEKLKESAANLTFELAEQPGLIVEQPAVQAAIAARVTGTGDNICLVTGKRDSTKATHPAIKGVWGAQSRGANIVSFNQDAFKSFHKEQGANAPVGEAAAFAYTTALNYLLRKDSPQRLQVGDASTVFWAEKANPLEEQMPSFFAEPPKDDPDRNVRAVESLYRAVQTGALPAADTQTRFYVLGLAPNASRIAVRFWIVDTVANMAGKICQYFEDTKIVHGPRDRDALSLFRQGKAENIPPNLSGDLMRAILEGLLYPQTLLQAAIRRVRAEHEIPHPRAALIKACLNRAARFTNPEPKEELHVSLDTTNPNVGYRLGRLFATLEKIQSEASPGINATIRDRFYGAASSTPVTVFGNLMRLKNHHLAKLESAGRRVQFDKLLGEIMAGISDFPAHLRLEDQGRFAIGYYHQMQDFFTKKTNNQPKED